MQTIYPVSKVLLVLKNYNYACALFLKNNSGPLKEKYYIRVIFKYTKKCEIARNKKLARFDVNFF